MHLKSFTVKYPRGHQLFGISYTFFKILPKYNKSLNSKFYFLIARNHTKQGAMRKKPHKPGAVRKKSHKCRISLLILHKIWLHGRSYTKQERSHPKPGEAHTKFQDYYVNGS